MADICISFPKSGRTWLRVMLDALDIPLEYDHAGSAYAHALHWQELDTSLADQYERIILLIRDPRDTVVSGYYQATRRIRVKYQGSLSEFIRDPRYGIEKIARFHFLWIVKARTCDRMLIVRYEDLQTDCTAQLERIVHFLGRDVRRARLQDVAKENRFDKMQARERAGAYADRFGDRFGADDETDPDAYKVRKGRVGGYLDELSPADVTYCNDVLERLGIG